MNWIKQIFNKTVAEKKVNVEITDYVDVQKYVRCNACNQTITDKDKVSTDFSNYVNLSKQSSAVNQLITNNIICHNCLQYLPKRDIDVKTKK